MDKYLPIGSIVLLKGGEKRVMIYGRKQKQLDTGRLWDYIACLYPEGHVNDEFTFLFNHDQIDRVFFIGFQDQEEFDFTQESLRD